jgi:hypothetical protein
MTSRFHTRLQHNKNRFEELNQEEVLFEVADTEFPVLVSPIKKRGFTLATSIPITQVERMWWGISLDQLIIPSGTPTPFLPEPGMSFIRENGDVLETYEVVADDNNPQGNCYDYITANRDRIIVCTVLASTEEN